MRAVALGLLVEEERGEVAATWRAAVDRELGGEPAISFAVGPLLRELSLTLRDDATPSHSRPEDAHARCAVLVRSGAEASRLVREFGLLHAALWDVLRASGRLVSASERHEADAWLDEALAVAVDRLDRQRRRADLFERPSLSRARTGAARANQEKTPPSEARPSLRPPPLSRRPPPLPGATAMVTPFTTYT